MPSAAEFGETQKIIKDDFTGDKTMASVSLRSRLTLNSRLSIKKPAHEARVSLVMKLFQGGFAALGTCKKLQVHLCLTVS